MSRILLIFCCAVLAAGLLWFFPLFHIERLDAPAPAGATQGPNTSDFAATFWDEKLVPSLERATNAEELISALRDKPQTARQQYGRKVGVSRTTLFIAQGEGTVVAIDKKGVILALADESKTPDVLLQTGLLFGNTVRDATGLLNAGEFQDSRQFNEISTELNRLVEARVIPTLKDQAAKGRRIQFAGCFEVPDEGELPNPLPIIPMQVRLK